MSKPPINRKTRSVLLIIAICGFIIYQGHRERQNLHKYKLMTIGQVEETSEYGRGEGINIHFSFIAKNKTYKGKTRIPIDFGFSEPVNYLLNGKNFPVIYDSTNAKNNCMLLMREDYLKYGYTIPDTLYSITEYLDSLKMASN
jgi:hypothetical protein